MPQLLLVEDDAAICSALVRALAERGYGVRTAATGMAGLQEAMEYQPDLVILDLGLPDIDGITFLTMLRAVSSIPVIIATARDDEQETVRALNAGADDYIVKPFAADHLDARVKAVLRRHAGAGGTARSLVVVGELSINVRAHEATLAGRRLDLSRKEFELLSLLAGRAGEVVSKRELMAQIWGLPYGGGDKTVDVHLSWLRRKLGESADAPRYVHSVRGVGVKLVAPS